MRGGGCHKRFKYNIFYFYTNHNKSQLVHGNLFSVGGGYIYYLHDCYYLFLIVDKTLSPTAKAFFINE